MSTRAAPASFAAPLFPTGTRAEETRLYRAERQGLRLAIVCRTVAVGIGFFWVMGAWLTLGYHPSPWVFLALGGFTLLGIAHALVIGTRYDRRWMKYAIYGLDTLGICAAFAFVPVSVGADVPQIIAFRAYGIYYLFPLVAMAALSLSPWLVLWTGTVAIAGWWAAFLFVSSDITNPLSWGDMPIPASQADYETIFLSIDFVGRGNRVEETGFLFFASATLALAVWRARGVFLAQLSAQFDRDRIAETLGRYVPDTIAKRLMDDPSALAPQERHAAVLVMDIAGFTAYAASRSPGEVIDGLNRFLAQCADAISRHQGVVIQFTGDGLMATFGTPIELQTPEQNAVDAAHALQSCAEEVGFQIRVGLAAGQVASGSIGSAQRQAFTVYGATVNRAARLEAHGKKIERSILMDNSMAAALAGLTLEPFENQALPGIGQPVNVYAA
ncbi:MAG: adenylate/guanylate cyclase domain-containing protein [Pseudomonadota bacterium]